MLMQNICYNKRQKRTQCSAEHVSTHSYTKYGVQLMIKSAAAGPRAYIAVATNPGSNTDVAAAQMWLPESSRAPRAYRVSKALSMAAVGGLSMKSKPTRSSKPRALSCRATVAKLTRWISGRVVAASWLKLASVKSLKALPAASRPA